MTSSLRVTQLGSYVNASNAPVGIYVLQTALTAANTRSEHARKPHIKSITSALGLADEQPAHELVSEVASDPGFTEDYLHHLRQTHRASVVKSERPKKSSGSGDSVGPDFGIPFVANA